MSDRIQMVPVDGKFLRSRADQLADYLGGCIARGELREPFPNIRALRLKLGVGLHTLERALRSLERQAVLRIRPRQGIQLLRGASPRPIVPKAGGARVVRWMFYGRDYPDMSAVAEILLAISERLLVHEIRLSVEKCDAVRLQAIHRAGENAGEMLLLVSLTEPHQRLFADFRKSALLLGLPFPGIRLAYVSVDSLPAMRHATQELARRGARNISLVIKEGTRMIGMETFQRFCVETLRPLGGRVVKLPMSHREQSRAASRFAAGLKGRHGVVAMYPVPASVLMTAIMNEGLRIPDEVEVVAVNTTMQGVRVAPLPTYYPYPVEALASILCKTAVQYFERDRLPPLRKMIPLEIVRPASS